MAKKVSVLTFGWEFPPHISGGLGTACYGLTKALLHQGTEILFVVPRAHGDEQIKLISASDVLIPQGHGVGGPETVQSILGLEDMRVIVVPSGIGPYSSPQVAPVTSVERWNYEIRETQFLRQEKRVGEASPARFRFSGTYGPDLFQEVVLYADAAAAIALHHKFDLIHAHDWLTFPAGIAAKKASRKPLVIHVHATEYDRTGSHNVDKRVLAIEKKGMEEADKIVAVSEWTRQVLISKYGVEEGKISVVHNGVITGKRRISKKPARLGKNMVTFLGRVTYQKGPLYFVEAARLVLEKFPDTHFVVAGSGDLLPAVMERVATLRLSEKFHFTGFLRGPQVQQVWSVSDVYVMPSVSEPFGITPLEAIQSGVPVILSNQSGVSEVMPHAIKADFWDIESLAGSICSLLRHKSLGKALRKHSKEALKDISWENAARKLNILYHEIQANSR